MAQRPRTFDLLVVGGGINGAGIARDAAMRGLSVLLVESHDWSAGTSSRSSMLAHGGLRYLEQFELGLVHEALQERERIFRQAPHLVRPLEFVYPIYPHIASRRTVRLGLFLYDLLSHGKSVPKRSYLSRSDVMRKLPGIETTDLKGGATYHDGQWQSVERFVLELVAQARAHGAVCLNHTSVERLLVEDGVCRGAMLRADTGVPSAGTAGAGLVERGEARLSQGGALEVRAAATINAAGPWVDAVLDASEPGPHHLIRKTKGIHIVVPRFVDDALIIRAKDGRTFFIIPWHDHCLVGTTDTDYRGDPREATATAEEVAYLQESARAYFPDAPLDEILWTYAGVRPLVNEEGLTESNVTRKHVLHDHADDGTEALWSIQGGKLTTYRSLAEHAVDRVCGHLGRRDAVGHPTRDAALPGGPEGPWGAFRERAIDEARETSGLPEASAAHLVETYGARWREVLDSCQEPDARARITDDHPHIWCELHHAVRHEQAATVGDFMLRRTSLGLGADGRMDVAKDVADRMARLLGWSRAQRRTVLAAYRGEVAAFAVPPDA